MTDDIKLDVFENNTYILKEDLFDYLKKITHYEKDSSIRWVVHELVKSGYITKIDSKHYYKGLLKDFSPKVETKTKKRIKEIMLVKYPELDCVIYEAIMFNEWINLQLFQNVIFVDVEKYYIEDVFTSLRNQLPNRVLLDPTTKDYYLYAENDLVIVSSLLTRAPIHRNSYEIKVEKVIVDLFSNDLVSKVLSQSEYETMIEHIFRMYKVNMKTIYSYAKRRNLLGITQKFLRQYELSEG